MTLKFLCLSFALAVAAGPAAAAPDEAAMRRDLRCVIVTGMIVSKTTDADTRMGVAASMGFFIGRLKGRDPALNLTARLAVEARGLKLADLGADVTRCGQEMQAFGQETKAAGEALKALGEGQAGAPT